MKSFIYMLKYIHELLQTTDKPNSNIRQDSHW